MRVRFPSPIPALPIRDGSPCWAPRRLIPVRVMVRFHRLLPARPAVEALHASKLVRLQPGPLHGPEAVGTAFSIEGNHPSRLPLSGAQTFSHLGVAQEQSSSLGTTRALVRFQSPRPTVFWM